MQIKLTENDVELIEKAFDIMYAGVKNSDEELLVADILMTLHAKCENEKMFNELESEND